MASIYFVLSEMGGIIHMSSFNAENEWEAMGSLHYASS